MIVQFNNNISSMSKIYFEHLHKKQLINFINNSSEKNKKIVITLKKKYDEHIKILFNNTTISNDIIDIINNYLIDIFNITIIQKNIHVLLEPTCFDIHIHFSISAEDISISNEKYSFKFVCCIKCNDYDSLDYSCSVLPINISNDALIHNIYKCKHKYLSYHSKTYEFMHNGLKKYFSDPDKYFTKKIKMNKHTLKNETLNNNCELTFDSNIFFNLYMKNVYDKDNYINCPSQNKHKMDEKIYYSEDCKFMNNEYKHILIDNYAHMMTYNIKNHKKLKNMIVIIKKIVEIISTNMGKKCINFNLC
jgi:hypothetical protein